VRRRGCEEEGMWGGEDVRRRGCEEEERSM
jgi:hypothetical protein